MLESISLFSTNTETTMQKCSNTHKYTVNIFLWQKATSIHIKWRQQKESKRITRTHFHGLSVSSSHSPTEYVCVCVYTLYAIYFLQYIPFCLRLLFMFTEARSKNLCTLYARFVETAVFMCGSTSFIVPLFHFFVGFVFFLPQISFYVFYHFLSFDRRFFWEIPRGLWCFGVFFLHFSFKLKLPSIERSEVWKKNKTQR